MLSYLHGFHAGNHADVLKHCALSLILESLGLKEKPFFYLDTHAGSGRYTLDSEVSQKKQEHLEGISKIWRSHTIPEALHPYIDSVRSINRGDQLRIYPGSPIIAQHFLRSDDRMHLCELHPGEFTKLEHLFARNPKIQTRKMDGYDAINALLPPIQRRGLVHIDPAFERKDERARLFLALKNGIKKWSSGIFMVWYPIQDRATANQFLSRLEQLAIPDTLYLELSTHDDQAFRLNGSALFVVNPPWKLDEKMSSALPWIWSKLSINGEGGWVVRKLS